MTKYELKVNFGLGGRQTDTRTDRQTQTHINTMIGLGLEAAPSSKQEYGRRVRLVAPKP